MSLAAPWTPERVVDTALARALIASGWPELVVRRIEWLGAGWDNTAFVVNGEWVFRFPRREVTVVSMRREIAALSFLSTRLPLAIPVPRYVSDGCAAFDWPFAGYRMVAGETACKRAWTDAQAHRAAPVLAAFLRALHAIRLIDVAGANLPVTRLDFGELATREERTGERLAAASRAGLLNAAVRSKLTAAMESAEPCDAPPVVLHGDLYARHVVVDDTGMPCGIIDWGDLQIGDAAQDLAAAYTMLPPKARDEMLASYGASRDAAQLARAVAVHHTLAGMAYAHAQGDADLLRITLAAATWLAMA